MKVKIGDVWRDGFIKAKLASLGWITPDRTLLKQNGIWEVINGIEVVNFTEITDVVNTTYNWTFDATRGWYLNVYDWELKHRSRLSPAFLSKVRKVSITFTGYYNNPADSMGVSGMGIILSNGASVTLGTSDSWDYAPTGQDIYKGDAGNEFKAVRNVIGERYTFTVPEGVTITDLFIRSSGYYYPVTGRYYPPSVRGMKDFEFTLRH